MYTFLVHFYDDKGEFVTQAYVPVQHPHLRSFEVRSTAFNVAAHVLALGCDERSRAMASMVARHPRGDPFYSQVNECVAVIVKRMLDKARSAQLYVRDDGPNDEQITSWRVRVMKIDIETP